MHEEVKTVRTWVSVWINIFDHYSIYTEERRKTILISFSDDDVTMSELQHALAKTSISQMHQTYDPNLTRDEQMDIVNQLKAKHEMLKQTHQRRARSPHGSRHSSLRRRKISQMSGDYESSTDYESRPTSVITEHAGRDNLAFISENDEVFENEKPSRRNIQLEEMNAKNLQHGDERRRKQGLAENPNRSVVKDYSDNDLNQNNSASHPFYYSNAAANPNGHIPIRQQSNKRSGQALRFSDVPPVSIISGNRATDSRQTARPPQSILNQNVSPSMRISTNGHTVRPDVDPDFEEVTYL